MLQKPAAMVGLGNVLKYKVDTFYLSLIQKLAPLTCLFNPLSPQDALKHHFASLKNDLIS